MKRQLSPIDRLLVGLDLGLRSVSGVTSHASRANPSQQLAQQGLKDQPSQLAGRLMRVNHAGEIAAQGLYQGQSLTARTSDLREHMAQSASEEIDHLAWCKQRCQECGEQTSRLDWIWYSGSFAIGALAGVAGDRWSLGFLAETENQVVEHLDEHLQRLDPGDVYSRRIIEQMKLEEAQHAQKANEHGAKQLPVVVKRLMRWTAAVMTRTAYWI